MLTLVEVFKVPETPDEEAAERRISAFFNNRWIRKQTLDWYVAQEARRLQRQFSHLDGRDAIHLATAVYLQVEYLHTYDSDDLIRCNGLIPNLVICEPKPFGMLPMNLGITST
jgi:predicted nucleic acid-binding protein